MAKKITYLLGAGASANVIPVVAFMHKRMEEILMFLKDCLPAPSIIIKPVELPEDKLGTLKAIIAELEWLIEQAGSYYTIDTLAKKYYLTHDDLSLRKLKKSLILYFTLEQHLNIESKTDEQNEYNFRKQPIDKRYGNFIAAITNKFYRLPGINPDALAYENLGFGINGNIKVLSWNYDVQFELNLTLFSKTIIQRLKKEFQILPNEKTRNEVNNIPIDLNRFGFIKLNGDAIWNRQFQQDFKYTIFDSEKNLPNSELLLDFLDGYETGNIDKGLSDSADASPLHCFNFAWENDNNYNDKYKGHSKNLEAAEMIASETEILVVIGYSFPIFNRQIDNRLLTKMQNLRKVYIQDRDPDKIKSTMQNAFEILQRKVQTHMVRDYEIAEEYIVDFHLDKSTSQFIIPYELNQ